MKKIGVNHGFRMNADQKTSKRRSRTERGGGQRPSRSTFAKQKAPSKRPRVHSGRNQRAELAGEGLEPAVEVALPLRMGSAGVPVALLRVSRRSFTRCGAGARPI